MKELMRTHQKRKRASGPRHVKRRRIFKRRFRTKNKAFTSRDLHVSNAFAFRGRKLKPKAYGRMLWRNTMLDAHNRSEFATAGTLVTPNNLTQLNWAVVPAFLNAAGSEFWKTAGGAQDPSFGVTPQWMNPNGAGPPVGFDPLTIVIRGGRIWVKIASTSTFDAVTCQIQLAFVKGALRNTTNAAASNTVQDYITALLAAGARPLFWLPNSAPDWNEYFHEPIMTKSITLHPAQTATIVHTIKPHKIDISQFQRGGGWFPMFFVTCSQDTNTNGAAETLDISNGHSIGFSVTDLPQ